jgi:hypothetical protein
LARIAFAPAPAGYEGWTQKLPHAIACASDRPVAWVDDRFGTDEAEWATTRSAVCILTLLLTTHGRIHLTEADVERLHAFAREVDRTGEILATRLGGGVSHWRRAP